MSGIAIENEYELEPVRRQLAADLVVETNGPSFQDLSPEIAKWLERHATVDGILTLLVRHTSASLTIQENADPDVQADLLGALDRLAPQSGPWRHVSEGPDDMPGHVKSALTDTTLSVPVADGLPTLGIWQSVFLIEHRLGRHARTVRLHYAGS